MKRTGSDILGGRGDIEFSSAMQAEAHEESERLHANDKSRRRMRIPSSGNPEDELIDMIDNGPKIDDETGDRFVAAAPNKTRWSDSGIETDEIGHGHDYGLDSYVEVDESKTLHQQSKQTPSPRSDIYDNGRAQKRYPSPEQKLKDALIKRNRKEIIH